MTWQIHTVGSSFKREPMADHNIRLRLPCITSQPTFLTCGCHPVMSSTNTMQPQLWGTHMPHAWYVSTNMSLQNGQNSLNTPTKKKRDRLGWWPRGWNRKHTEMTYQEYSPLIRVESTCLATPCLSTNDVPVLTSCIQICVGEYPWISRYLIPSIFSYAIHLYMENGWAFPSHISKYGVYIYTYMWTYMYNCTCIICRFCRCWSIMIHPHMLNAPGLMLHGTWVLGGGVGFKATCPALAV